MRNRRQFVHSLIHFRIESPWPFKSHLMPFTYIPSQSFNRFKCNYLTLLLDVFKFTCNQSQFQNPNSFSLNFTAIHDCMTGNLIKLSIKYSTPNELFNLQESFFLPSVGPGCNVALFASGQNFVLSRTLLRYFFTSDPWMHVFIYFTLYFFYYFKWLCFYSFIWLYSSFSTLHHLLLIVALKE